MILRQIFSKKGWKDIFNEVLDTEIDFCNILMSVILGTCLYVFAIISLIAAAHFFFGVNP